MNENKTPIKPVTLIREDFINNLVEMCNNSGLPFFVIESILKDMLQEIHLASQRQVEADKKKYKEMLLKEQVDE